MKKIFSMLSAFLSRLFGNGSKHQTPAAAHTKDFYSGSTRKPLGQIISEAFDQNHKPVLYFHADWCGAAVKFKAALSDPRMREALGGAVLIIIDSDVDMDQDRLSETYHIRHVPTFIRVKRDGSMLKAITGAEWGEDLIENMAPVMKTFLQ